ncbi:MAG TPA: hypothetical protein VHT92_09085 [Candidatus Cybelea sp.]|jgi:hypothetical protein|nr:hypothetical protein [Candidatus Cybelea sp.]
MDFELLDGYLLDGVPSKSEVVRALLDLKPEADGAAPFYEGLARLGSRTPDLALIALRLVLAGRKADDATVIRLRDMVTRARAGDGAAREEYRSSLEPLQQ